MITIRLTGHNPGVTLLEARADRRPPAVVSASWRERLAPHAGTLAVALLAVVAAVHAVVVAPHYHVGSFDDDGHYLGLARAFLHGKGYVDTSLPGAPTETLYPPGYPALLAPLLWLFGGAMWPLRALSALAFVACVPLADALMCRHRLPLLPRMFALALFALSPVAATFATMVMPETVFLVVLLCVLLALPRWEEQDRLVTKAAAVVALGTPFLLLLKSAALPMVGAVVLWLALRRHFRKAALVAATSVLLLAPVLVLRLLAGSVVGDRYAGEYSRHHSLVGAVLSGVHGYVTMAIPASILQWFSTNLSHDGVVVGVAMVVFRYTAAALVLLGWLAWLRRRPDVTALLVPLYLLETLPFPYINERRVILVLPLVLAWYALGWVTVGRALRRWRPVMAARLPRSAYAAVPLLLVLPAVGAQFPRNYLLSEGQQTSRPAQAGYVEAVRAATPPGWNVATSYRWTISYYSGRTARNEAFLDVTCPPQVDASFAAAARGMFQQQHAATVLIGTLNRPTWLDSPCLLALLPTVPWAVPVYSGSDHTSLFTLLGPGTARPQAQVAVAQDRPRSAVVPLPAATPVTEVSVEVADPGARVAIQVHRAGGGWRTVAVQVPAKRTARGPLLLDARLPAPMTADAVRVVGAPASALQHLVVLRGR